MCPRLTSSLQSKSFRVPPRGPGAVLLSCAMPREDASKHASGGVKAHSSCAGAAGKQSWARRASPSAPCTSYLDASLQDTKATKGL